MTETQVVTERDERGVVTFWLNNPRRLNALSNEMVIGICGAMAQLMDDESCRAIVLRGRGGVFCAGRDLGDLKALQSAGAAAISEMYDYMRQLNEVIYYSPHPTITIVEKYALGIATMIVSWTDFAIAEERALLGYPEVHHGITPYGAIPTMLNTMNQKAMMDLLLTGRKIDAVEAVRLGLVTRAVPANMLTAELDSVLADLARGSAAAITKSKQFVRHCETLTYQQGIEAASDKHIHGIGASEMGEGLSAFLEKKGSNT